MNKVILISVFFLIFSSVKTRSQEEIIDFLNAGIEDANTLGEAYLRPYGEMLGVSLNGAWYNTAKVHKLLGFDVMFSGSYVTVPSGGKSFDVSELSLQKVAAKDGNIAPTMAAGSNVEQTFYFKDDPFQTDMLTIKGSGLDYFVSPMIQAAVGLPFHTEVMGRFMPKVEIFDYGKISMWGLGFKHSMKDYIPFIKRIPFLELSVLGAYTNFNSNIGVEYKGSSGELDMNANAYTARALVGVNIPVLSVYGGFGYGHTTSNFDVKGTFTGIPFETGPVENPIALAYTTNGFDFNVGVRLRLAIFAIYADYTVGDYSVITAGVGFNFR